MESAQLILTLYVIDAAVIVVMALLALHWRYRSVSDIRMGVIWVGLGLLADPNCTFTPMSVLARS